MRLEDRSLKKKLLLLGGGGHCHSVVDSIQSLGIYDEIGILDGAAEPCLGVPVIGTDADIPELVMAGWTEAFVTVGSVGNTRVRRKLYEMLKGYGLSVPIIIDPTAVVARGTQIQEGTFVGKRAVVNSGADIGVCSIINTGSMIEHDCVIGDFAHISPGCTLCGQVIIGNDTHVGAGAVVKQLITIRDHVLIGAGSVVVKDIPPGVKAYGNPCKVVK